MMITPNIPLTSCFSLPQMTILMVPGREFSSYPPTEFGLSDQKEVHKPRKELILTDRDLPLFRGVMDSFGNLGSRRFYKIDV